MRVFFDTLTRPVVSERGRTGKEVSGKDRRKRDREVRIVADNRARSDRKGGRARGTEMEGKSTLHGNMQVGGGRGGGGEM